MAAMLPENGARINRKLNVHSTGDLVRFAAQNGLLYSADAAL